MTINNNIKFFEGRAWLIKNGGGRVTGQETATGNGNVTARFSRYLLRPWATSGRNIYDFIGSCIARAIFGNELTVPGSVYWAKVKKEVYCLDFIRLPRPAPGSPG